MAFVRFGTGKDYPELEKELNNIANEFEKSFGSFFGRNYKNDRSEWSPDTDISETDNEYRLKIDMPGVEKSSVKISLQDGVLKVSGERKAEIDDKSAKYHKIERANGKYSRSYNLPDYADAENINAKFDNGQLEIVIPKTEKAKSKEIPISVN